MRCMIALDVQQYFKPAQGTVQQIQQLTTEWPTLATVFKHDELKVPLEKLGKSGPGNDICLINNVDTVDKYGYLLPDKVIQWLKANGAREVLITGGHNDANVLAVGFQLFDHGFKPLMVPVLCYGNDWYMHTVTTGIWQQEIGTVFESVAELKFS